MKRHRTKLIERLRATSAAQGRSPRKSAKSRAYLGFTLLELMIVISVMMILMAVALPFYQHHVIQAREAVLRQNLDTLRRVLEQYRLDKGQSPQTLEDLVTGGYLPKLPIDPMTNKADWTTEPEDSTQAVDPQQTGIGTVHSASAGTSLTNEPYSSW